MHETPLSTSPTQQKTIRESVYSYYGIKNDQNHWRKNLSALYQLLVDEIDASRGDSILNEQANVNRGKSISATFC